MLVEGEAPWFVLVGVGVKRVGVPLRGLYWDGGFVLDPGASLFILYSGLFCLRLRKKNKNHPFRIAFKSHPKESLTYVRNVLKE